MHVNKPVWTVFLVEMIDQVTKNQVLEDITMVAGMKSVTIAKHVGFFPMRVE